MPEVLRYAAFTLGGEGGNPAGVVLDATELDDVEMQRIAADVGYSETAFLRARPDEPNVYDVRYFAPKQEVPFCGHATIASAVALAEREPAAEMVFHTPAGLVTINTEDSRAGVVAELTSVAPRVMEPPEGLVDRCLRALDWAAEDLHPDYPPRLANAGAEHLVLVVRSHQRLRELDYDFAALADIMAEHDLVTLQLVWPKSKRKYFARNPFPPGGVVEDPATGGAAAAFGGYLRDLGLIGHTASFVIRQGAEMGRPSLIEVSVMEGEPGVRVRGLASPIEGE
jgi:PhzF family phenazine biosynthesis protein